MPRVTFALPWPCLGILPSLPPTVRDLEVAPLFRERFVLSGYRPAGQPWRCYALSLFHIHNQTLNAWSHLLAAACVVARFTLFGISLDASSLPLVLYAVSAVTYLSCSAAAHLLQSHSEAAHYSLFLLGYVGVAIYQYGCALTHYLYSADAAWTQSMLGQVFLPAAAVLAWLSCATCCFAKLHFRRPYPPYRNLCQVLPMGVAYLLDISPVAHRMEIWVEESGPDSGSTVVLFLLSVFFFSCPVPERFSPGSFDIVGHSHQLFHVLLSLCTLAQQEALFLDFLWRRGQGVELKYRDPAQLSIMVLQPLFIASQLLYTATGVKHYTLKKTQQPNSENSVIVKTNLNS
uniref:Uncharacterized protein n=1 Tax=Mola mola TaxID=94237 RepID=A0A3Q3VM03_MOLML